MEVKCDVLKGMSELWINESEECGTAIRNQTRA
jgi:hypothetical protein